MEYSLVDLIDGDALKQLCEKFTKFTQATIAVLDLDGTILVATGWQDICTQFHRVNLDTASRCNESDTTLAKRLRLGEKYNVYKCKNGLVDAAVPIIINENHVGNLFTGQFFFKPPDKEHFSRQAIEFGFEEDSYLEALSRVPVFTEEQIKLTMDFLCELAQTIGTMALNNLRALEINKKLGKEITKRKQAVEKERASRAYLGKILNNIGDPVFVKDGQHRFTLVNDAFCSTLGLPRGEIIGKTLSEDLPPNEQDHFLEIDRQVLTDGQENLCEELLTVKSGETLTILTKKSRYENKNGDKFIIGVIRDITERKKAEKEKAKLEIQLQQAHKMEAIGTLAGGIAHDFNNILGGIIGYGEMMEIFEVENRAEMLEKVGRILQAAYRAKDLVNQILAFSRKVSVDFDTVNLIPLIKETLLLLRASFPATITIETTFTTENDTIYADPTQIHQVLINLCTNAVDSMKNKGGTLTISLSEIESADISEPLSSELLQGSLLLLEVKDTGHGFSSDLASRIFDPYFTTKNVGEGTGMGLALVYGIVSTHHGFISAKSQSNVGSVFRIFLPQYNPVKEAPNPNFSLN